MGASTTGEARMTQPPYKYIIKLSEAERKELEGVIRSGKSERRIADRARIILWADEGLTIGTTVEHLRCSRQIVVNWRREVVTRREQEGAVKALTDQPRPGRPKRFSP